MVAGCCLSLVACTTPSDALVPKDAKTPFGNQAQVAAHDFAVDGDDVPTLIKNITVDPKHTYSLAELIDIAETNDPATRTAWTRAKQAAAQVGVAQSTYLPMLSASVLAGYAQTSSIAPGLKAGAIDIPNGVLTTTGAQVTPALTVNWLLFDFGERKAAADAAKDMAYAANVGFNGAHQRLIFEVSNAYFQLAAARTQLSINAEALKNASQVLAATNARKESGIATTIETAQASQQVAQAKFDLVQAKGTEEDAYGALFSAMGISPTTRMKVQNVGYRRLPRFVPQQLDNMIEESLRHRPDVLAAFAKAKADKKGIAAAKARFLPKVAVTGSYNRSSGQMTVADSRLSQSASGRFNQPNGSIMLGISVPIFDGGLRAHQLDVARSNAEASQYDLRRVQNAAAQEIVVAYNAIKTGLSSYSAASELVRAARTTYDAALDYYKHGLGTLADVSVAQNGLLKARLSQAKALSDSLTAAASFAFATGALTNTQAIP